MSPVVSNAVRAASRFRPIRTWLAVAALPLTAAVTLAMAPAQGAGAKPAAQSKPAAAPAAQSAGSGELFRVDDVHSLALCRVHHLGAGQFWGRFNAVSGTIRFAEGSSDGLSFEITIDATSVDTGVEQLDKHLKSPDFFNVKEFPQMTFKSTSASREPNGTYTVKGDLTIRGVTKPISAAVEWTGTSEKGMGKRAGFEATFTVDRSLFGVNYGLDDKTGDALGRNVRVVVALEAISANSQPQEPK